MPLASSTDRPLLFRPGLYESLLALVRPFPSEGSMGGLYSRNRLPNFVILLRCYYPLIILTP